MAEADIPAGPAHGLDDLRTDPHLQGRGFFETFEHPSEGSLLMPGVPMAFSRTPGAIRSGPPQLGEHTDEVLATAGYARAEIERIKGRP
jgi:crotonobetainyl-CoA:carnitine CoA-transferase CaiB-like acyl-CoA transferase